MMGKLISFIGMDGAGKTSLVNLLKKELEKKNYSVKIVYAGRGKSNILPIQLFGKIYRKSGGSESNVPIIGKNFERINMIHTVAAPIFAFDMFLRYLFIILPSQLKNNFVLTDRYSTDILLMIKVPGLLKQLLYSFFPKPNKVFYIYNTIKILHKRKPNHSIKDLKRQEKIFKKLLPKINAEKIKNDSLSKSVSKILRAI